MTSDSAGVQKFHESVDSPLDSAASATGSHDRLMEAPELTPVFRTPAHVDQYDYGNDGDVEKHYSRVFHLEYPGRIVAIFYGENHKADSEAFCDWCQKRVSSDL